MSEQKEYKRLTEYLEEYWQKAKGEREFPAFDDINIDDLAPEFRKDSFILRFLPTVTQHTVSAEFIGSNLSEDFIHDDSGVDIKNVIIRFLERPMDYYNKVIQTKQPIVHNVEISKNEGAEIKYRQILLPLGPADDQPVSAVLGGMRFKKG